MAARYNAYIEPLQILIYIPTLLIFILLRRGTKQDTSRGVLLLLAAEWAMVGVLFFFIVMGDVHWVGYVAGGVCIATALYFAVSASLAFPPHFHWRADNPTLLSLLVIAFGVLGYPGVSWLLGREYPAVTTYGLMPGSVALLTLGVALSARPGPRLWMMAPALFFMLISVATILWWKVWEDYALLPAAVLGMWAWKRWHRKNLEAPTKDTIRFDF